MSTFSLDLLPINCTATIDSIFCDNSTKQRFLALGIVPNTLVTAVLVSPFGNPIAYEIRKTIIALRQEDAKSIIIKL